MGSNAGMHLSRDLREGAVTGLIKLALQAGKANPAPPVGPALGAKVCFPSFHSTSLLS